MLYMITYESIGPVWLVTNGRMPVAGPGNIDLNEYANCISTSRDRKVSDAYLPISYIIELFPMVLRGGLEQEKQW